jgi:hypothetical protein
VRLQLSKETYKCTNNIAEYEAILLGLQKLRAIGVQRCILCINSKVVAGQIEKECIAMEPRMGKNLNGFTVECIDRNKNSEADELAKVAARNNPLPVDVFLQTITDASIKTI